MITLMLVDDMQCVRVTLRNWLTLEPDLKIVGEAEDGAQAVEMAHALKPDVLVMDVKMPHMDGIEATGKLHEVGSSSKVVLISLYDDAETRTRSEASGAAAFLPKDKIEDHLLPTIRSLTAH
jgi:DNA-binding NarL/FixJ family response regulator